MKIIILAINSLHGVLGFWGFGVLGMLWARVRVGGRFRVEG